MVRSGASLLALLILSGTTRTARAEDAGPAGAAARSAPQLVQAAQRAELAGQNAERQRLLVLAVAADPLHEPARWQSGYVNVDGKWQAVDAAGDPSQVNPDRAQYFKLRNKMADDAAGNLRLADFCRGRKLADEARAHWLRVVQLEPNNKEARERLGYQYFRGFWLTQVQIAEVQAYEKRLREANNRWKPRLERLRGRLVHKQESIRKAAVQELQSIKDAEAALPLEHYLAGASQQSDLALIGVLGKLKSNEATLALTRCAVASPRPEVREAAARQLKDHDQVVYAPVLLAAMYTPKAQHQVARTADGGVGLRQIVTVERQSIVDRVARDTLKYLVADLSELNPVKVNIVGQVFFGGTDPETVRAAEQPLRDFNAQQLQAVQERMPEQMRKMQDAARLAQWQSQVELARKAIDLEARARVTEQKIIQDAQHNNERLAYVLNVATGQNMPADPAVWWRWWDEYTSLTPADKPVRNGYSKSISVSRVQATVTPLTLDQYEIRDSLYHSCFAAGTPVSTISGPRPIETIRIGDLVLSQDADSGELVYKPVLGTTTGPATMFMKLTMGERDENIQCTPNHLFWANRTGWVKAEELVAGSYLHGVRGAVPVWTVEPGKKEKTYNLIVADFHSYFVGQSRVLVHDNTMWEPGESLVPGMTVDSVK